MPSINMGQAPFFFAVEISGKKNHWKGFTLLQKKIDHWIFFSEHSRHALLKLGVSKKKTTLIRHGVDERFFAEAHIPIRKEKVP